MSRPSRACALALAAAVALTACTSANNRRGLMVLGGASVIMGTVIAVDGALCDDVAQGEVDCEDDEDDLRAGLGLLALGLVIGGIGAYLHVTQDKPSGP